MAVTENKFRKRNFEAMDSVAGEGGGGDVFESEARDYQVELFEKALEQNVIVWLETGAGKTFIATLLIRELSGQTVQPYGTGSHGKRTIVLVDSVVLAKQQASYIQKHTCLKVKYFVGEMNVDFWDKVKWLEELNNCQVLVMTAAIVVDMLNHQYLSLDYVNLLLFDECHHGANNHPYKVIMNWFASWRSDKKKAAQLDGRRIEEGPRIMGLSACLFKGKVKNSTQMLNKLGDLEKTFFAKIVTTSFDTSVYGARPDEAVLNADVKKDPSFLALPSVVELGKCVDAIPSEGVNGVEALVGLVSEFRMEDSLISHNPGKGSILKSLIGDLKHCYETMGVNALQIYLEKILREISESNRKNHLTTRSNVESQFVNLVSVIEDVRVDAKRLNTDTFLNLSAPKLFVLKKALIRFSKLLKTEKRDFCGIVFVQRRYSTVVLNQIILNWASENGSLLSHLKPVFATGQVSSAAGCKNGSMTGKEQIVALRKFRNGQANLLIATNVVEEGIDIPHCNFVCKYDIPQDFRSYTQSKGRARAKNSQYVIITTPEEHVDFTLKVKTIFRPIEDFLTKKCFDRTLPSEQESVQYFESIQSVNLAPFAPFDYPGAPRVTAQTALNLVNRYCNTLPADRFTSMKARVKIEDLGGSFIASMSLPSSSVITEPVLGDPQNSKQEAKVSAALAVCKLLYEKGELDCDMLPKRVKVGNETRAASRLFGRRLSNGVSESLVVFDKKYPRQFSHPVHEVRSFYLYEIKQIVLDYEWICDFVPDFVSSEDYRIGFLAADKIPQIPNFLIYSLFGTENVSIAYVKEIILSNEEKEAAVELNRWIYEEILLVPGITLSPNSSPYSIITTIFDKTYRLLTSHQIRQHSKTLPWENAVVVQFPNTESLNFVEKCENGKAQLRVVGKRILYLTKERTKKSNYRPSKSVSDLQRMEYPAVVLYRAMCLPAVLHRVTSLVYTETFLQDLVPILNDKNLEDSLRYRETIIGMDCAPLVPTYYDLEKPDTFLHAFREQYQRLDICEGKPRLPLPTMALKSFTLKSAHSGDDINLERFEVLGDAFLKFAVSKALFCQNPSHDEGRLTEEKHIFVSNAKLSKIADEFDLGSYVFAQAVVPRENWLPPLFISKAKETQLLLSSGDTNRSLSSKSIDRLMQHKFKRKCLADVIESLIGLFVYHSSHELALKFTQHLGIPVLPFGSDTNFEILSPRIASEQTSQHSDEEAVKLVVGLDQIEDALKYKFTDKLWLVQALTHATYTRNSITTNYQRLEFLGDAILDFLITRHIHNAYRNMDPGKLTDLRSALVNNVLFASLSVLLGLYRALKHMSSRLDYEIDKFVEFITSTSDDGSEKVSLITFCDLYSSPTSDSPLTSSSSSRASTSSDSSMDEEQHQWMEDPKPLGDIFEATVGAIYMDSGFDLDCVWRVVFPLMEDVIRRYAVKIPLMPVRELYELFPHDVIFEEVTDEGETIVLQNVGADSPKAAVGAYDDERYWNNEQVSQTLKSVKVTVKDKVFEAKSNTLKNAKRKVAKKALDYFQSNSTM